MVNHKHYTYRITWSELDQEYVALCAEFPSLSYLATSPTEALLGIIEVVAEVVKDMVDNGELAPLPLASRQYSGRFQVRVTPEMHRNLTIQAAEQGVSLNRLIAGKLNY